MQLLATVHCCTIWWQSWSTTLRNTQRPPPPLGMRGALPPNTGTALAPNSSMHQLPRHIQRDCLCLARLHALRQPSQDATPSHCVAAWSNPANLLHSTYGDMRPWGKQGPRVTCTCPSGCCHRTVGVTGHPARTNFRRSRLQLCGSSCHHTVDLVTGTMVAAMQLRAAYVRSIYTSMSHTAPLEVQHDTGTVVGK
jgi:hypothetical protein